MAPTADTHPANPLGDSRQESVVNTVRCLMQRPMVRLYDLRDQPDHIAAMQRTSLDDSDMGLAPDPLVGSDEWWGQVGTGERPLHRVDGVAPGPGGAGYELDRRFGEAVHPLRVPSRAAGEQLLTGLERKGRVGACGVGARRTSGTRRSGR